jgi:hypothetical protein
MPRKIVRLITCPSRLAHQGREYALAVTPTPRAPPGPTSAIRPSELAPLKRTLKRCFSPDAKRERYPFSPELRILDDNRCSPALIASTNSNSRVDSALASASMRSVTFPNAPKSGQGDSSAVCTARYEVISLFQVGTNRDQLFLLGQPLGHLSLGLFAYGLALVFASVFSTFTTQGRGSVSS